MRQIIKILKNIVLIPKKLFSKISIFSIIIDSKIDKSSVVMQGCRVYNSRMDKFSYVGRNSIVINADIGRFTSIANDCNIGLASHNLEWLSTSPVFCKGNNCLKKNFANIEFISYKKTSIGNDVWIGANVLIKGGVTIGDGAVVGAGSVITKDIPPYAIYAGNPAKLIRYRYNDDDIKKLLEAKWWEYNEKKLYNINTNTNDINIILNDLNKNKILIQAIYAAPYRVGVFEEMSLVNDIDVFFERLSGHNRNKEFFKNNNKLNSYNLEREKDFKIYKEKIKNIKQYDCVFVYDYSSFLSIKLMLKCIKNKVPYCINCDGYLIPSKKNISFYLKKIIKSYFIKRADRLLANGDSAKNYFLMYGADKSKIDNHNFSSLYKKDILDDIVSNKQKIKKNLGLDNKRLYISVGSFDYIKGFDLIIEAAYKLKDYSSQYVLIGGGNFLDVYKKKCSEYGMDNFKFVEFLKKEDLIKYYDAADAFIFPTRGDIWGLVINEAMSRGLPVISTDRCNAALEMINKKNGIVIGSDSVIELSEAIDKFNSLSDEELNLMGNSSLEISRKYNIEDIAVCHNETIKKVMLK